MKVDFLKVENILSDTLRKLFIERLTKLGAIANLINDSHSNLPKKMIEEIVIDFQNELKKIKEKDQNLYQKLEISLENEQHFNLSPQQFTQEDWLSLKLLKEKIEDVKRELLGKETFNEHDDKQIEKERRKHIYKRFNIREHWLPLH
jgi:hypothetical protein